jgi:hypothetical protein
MRGYFGLGQLSASEKQDILNQHKSLYNGYQTMQPQVSNTQPLYVYDAAGDKEGFVVNNRGEVKKYTNMGINEQVETKEVCDDCGAMIMDGMCTECNYGHMEEGMGETCEQCGGTMKENVCEQCGGSMKEETGHLDDIYDEEDLNPSAGFDYIEGSSNNVDTFEKMHKNLYEDDDFEDFESSYTEDGVDDPDNEDDGFEDMNASEVTDGELDEYDADDMDVSDVEPAYDFESNGPGDVYPVNELDEDDMYGYDPEKMYEYDEMESAWADEELEEQPDISGVQGIYGDMDRAYDFTSDGPGKGGPYQEFSYESELDEDEEFTSTEDDFEEVDEDLKESFTNQRNKIMEMFNRFNKYN